MAVDNIARALAAKALESSAGSVTPEDLEKTIDGVKKYVDDEIAESITTVLNTPA